MGVLFDSDDLVEHEAARCIHCDSLLSQLGCVKCKAQEASGKATTILIMVDSQDNVVSRQEIWIH